MDFLSTELYKLQIISKVLPGQKLETHGECLSASNPGFMAWVNRVNNRDSRQKVMRAIRQLIDSVIEISKRIMESKYFAHESKKNNMRIERIRELKQIYTALIEVQGGLANQEELYKTDSDIVLQIKKMTGDAMRHVHNLKAFLQELGELTL